MRRTLKLLRMPRLSLRARGMLVLAFPVLALTGAVMTVLWLERDMAVADSLIRRAVSLRGQIETVQNVVCNADSAVRGWLATGDEHYLQPYGVALSHLEPDVVELRRLAAQNQTPSRRMQEIEAAAREEMAMLRQIRTSRTDAATRRQLLARSQFTLDRFRSHLDSLRADVNRLFDLAGESRALGYQQFSMLAVFCGIAGPFGGLVLNLLMTRRLARRVGLVGANAHRLATGQAIEDMPGGSDEIANLGREIQEAAALLSARQNRLAESEKRFRELFDQAPVPYHETGPDGIVLRVNEAECRLFGYAASEIVGKPAWEFIAPEDRAEVSDRLHEAIRTGVAPPVAERDYILADGSRSTLEIHENLIRMETGEISGTRAALLDVTEHKVAVMAARKVEQYAHELRNKNEQLARTAAAAHSATEAKSRFLANMSHELRTPLNGIIGFSELMHDGKVGPVSGEHREFLADILTSANHLLTLINDILDISKIESGKFEFRPERCDLVRLAREACAVLDPLALQKRLSIRIDNPGSIPAELDPARFKQVLYNYVSNAVKFTSGGGRVDVRLRRLGGARVLLEVEDNGPGVALEDQPRLFREFEQLAANRKDGQGTGLGLALTKRLVEAQGGSVGVESVPGRGSRFFAELPLSATKPVDVPAPAARSRSILVVDENPQEARTILDILTPAGYAVEIARSGTAALDACRARCFDAITLDLLLPDSSGWDILSSIRSTGLNRSTPVVVVSVAAEQEMNTLFPIQDCLPKPVDAAQLLRSLGRAGSPPHPNRTVLVVDDDPATLHLVQATLAGLGYRTICCADGPAGLTAIARERPALVLLDLALPTMDGFQFLDRLHADDSMPHPPIVVWTGEEISAADRLRLQPRVQAILDKQDCTPKSLLDQLKRVCA
jgi:PAS domain S-box-containing protein